MCSTNSAALDSLAREHAPIGKQCLASKVAGFLAGQKQCCAGDFTGLPHALHGCHLHHGVHPLRRLPNVRGHRRFDKTGSDGVNTNITGAVFRGYGLGKHDYRCF